MELSQKTAQFRPVWSIPLRKKHLFWGRWFCGFLSDLNSPVWLKSCTRWPFDSLHGGHLNPGKGHFEEHLPLFHLSLSDISSKLYRAHWKTKTRRKRITAGQLLTTNQQGHVANNQPGWFNLTQQTTAKFHCIHWQRSWSTSTSSHSLRPQLSNQRSEPNSTSMYSGLMPIFTQAELAICAADVGIFPTFKGGPSAFSSSWEVERPKFCPVFGVIWTGLFSLKTSPLNTFFKSKSKLVWGRTQNWGHTSLRIQTPPIPSS